MAEQRAAPSQIEWEDYFQAVNQGIEYVSDAFSEQYLWLSISLWLILVRLIGCGKSEMCIILRCLAKNVS